MRMTVLSSALCLVFLAGCAQNPAESALNETEAALADTTAALNQFSISLETALKETPGDQPLTKEKLKPSIEKAKALKDASDRMMAAKVRIDSLQQKLTDSERASLLERCKESTVPKFNALDSAYDNLRIALTEVERRALKADDEASKSAFEGLQKVYREGKEKFEIIAKAR